MVWKTIGLAVFAAGIGVMASCQTPHANRFLGSVVSTPQEQATLIRPATRDVIRQIDDPHTGDRWLLIRDPAHPGGPGWLVRVAGGSAMTQPKSGDAVPRTGPESERRSQPVIRRGERLVVEESTSKVDARFEAIALGSALPGSPLRVRLVLGGKVIGVVALGPGRAAFALKAEVLP